MNVETIPETALIVDDESHVRTMLQLVLNSLGIRKVDQVSDGHKAVHQYAEYPTDIVLMDINMPNMTGVEALESIQELDPDSVIIMLTSMNSRKMVEQCAALGASYYIRKDSSVDDIRSELTKVFEEIFA